MSFLGGLGAKQRDDYTRFSNPPSPFIKYEIENCLKHIFLWKFIVFKGIWSLKIQI